MPAVKLDLTPRIAELLQAGVISITAELFGSGKDVYGRVTQPHPKLGLYPHQSMTLDELEPLLERVSLRSSNYTSTLGEERSGSPNVTPTKKGMAIRVLTRDDAEIGKVPTQICMQGVANTLPKDSLCWKDLLHLSDDQLNRRLLAVGREIGPDKVVSRIECSTTLSSPEKPTLYKWWESATNIDRFTVLTSSKKTGKEPRNSEELQLALSRLGAGQYPFRGTDRPMATREEEEEEEEDELSERFNQGLVLEYEDSE